MLLMLYRLCRGYCELMDVVEDVAKLGVMRRRSRKRVGKSLLCDSLSTASSWLYSTLVTSFHSWYKRTLVIDWTTNKFLDTLRANMTIVNCVIVKEVLYQILRGSRVLGVISYFSGSLGTN